MDNIAVTGMGVVSPLGSDVQSLWKALVKGVSGIERIDALEGLPVNIGGPAKG
ncbi:MAG: beta-ketoacyl-[acyl-carrier-protein] synthase II, partial [Deltaproteobacteria bacterium]